MFSIVEFALAMLIAMFLFGWFCFTLLALVGYLYNEQPENFLQATGVALRGFPKSVLLGLVLTIVYPLG